MESLLRTLLLPANFKAMSFVAGISIVGFATVVHFLMRKFGSFCDIPSGYRTLLYFLIGIDFAAVSLLKLRSLLSIEWQGRRIPYFQILKEFQSFRIFHLQGPIVAVAIILSAVLIAENRSYYVVPALSVGLGFLYNFYGSLLRFRQYLITGYWLIATGTAIFAFPQIPVMVALGLSIGCGFILFGIVTPSRH